MRETASPLVKTVFYCRRGVLQHLNKFWQEVRTTKPCQTPMIAGDS